VGAFVMNHQFGLEQGFMTYRDVSTSAPSTFGAGAGTEITADGVTDGAIELLRQLAGERFFLFVHYFDPHQPYKPPAHIAAEYMDAYTGEVAFVDEQIGRLLAAVDESGIAERTLIVLTSDHGEGLGQHHEATHAFFVYDSTLRVPLILRCPSRVPAGKRVSGPVRTIDIVPTVLSLVGLPAAADVQGVDLSPLLTGDATDLELDAYAETFYTKYNMGYAQLRALRSGGWKYVHAPQPELYHVAEDPEEIYNRAQAQPERVEQMRARLRELIATAPRVVLAGQARRQPTAQEIQRLQSLGYVGGESPSAPDEPDDELALFDPTGSNPVDHVRQIQLMTHAVGLVQAGDHKRLEPVLRQLLAEFGDRSDAFIWAHAQLAGALAAQGKLDEALKHFDLALEARPEDGQMHTMKAIVLKAQERYDEALAACEAALRLEPVFTVTHLTTASLLARQGRTDAAVAQYEAALEKEPLLVRAHVGLARLLAQAGRRDEAIGALDRATEALEAAGRSQAAGQLGALRERLRNEDTTGAAP
jgi:tetratricopeptide (TPR) repeat protein